MGGWIHKLLWTALLVTTGCRAWQTPPLSGGQTLTLDQLIVTSDFPLPVRQPLLDEIRLMRGDVSQTLRLPTSDEPIHVCLFGTGEAYHTFVKTRYPGFPDRRAFFIEQDARLMIFAHWNERVDEDLRHEVSHGYLHSIVRNLPLWLDEGLAEYFEVPRGTHGLNRPHIDELRAALQAGTWRPDMLRLERLSDPATMTQLDYAEAWAWVHLLLETDPPRRELLQKYLAALRKEGTALPLSVAVRSVGITPEQSLREYLEQLAR